MDRNVVAAAFEVVDAAAASHTPEQPAYPLSFDSEPKILDHWQYPQKTMWKSPDRHNALLDIGNGDDANVLPTCSVCEIQMGMILLFFGGLEVEAVGCEYLGVRGEVCAGL